MKALNRLTTRRFPATDVYTIDQARELSLLSRALGRQLGMLIDRKGRVDMVLVGEAGGILIPELPRARSGADRLRGLRLLHTHLTPDGLSQEDLMDLLFLRLDAIIVLTVNPDGDPVQWQEAHLLPTPVAGQPYRVEQLRPWDQTSAHFAATAEALEEELARRSDDTREASDAPRALLVSVAAQPRIIQERNLDELAELARTAGLAVLVALCVGIPLGCLSAYNRGKWADNLIIVFATCGIAIPSFISSVVLLYTFGMNLKLLPTVGLNEPAAYIMPVTALAIYPTAYITRLMRSSLLDVMGQDYMRTARAKGVSSVKILFKHALRNAILPVITYVGPMLAGLMTGSFVVEKIFSIPGLGRDFVSAITNRDYMMIMGTTILLATLVIVANVVVDILYKIIDPRIKLK